MSEEIEKYLKDNFKELIFKVEYYKMNMYKILVKKEKSLRFYAYLYEWNYEETKDNNLYSIKFIVKNIIKGGG